MRPPAYEFRLFLDAPGESWNYIVKRSGEVIAASDGDDHLSNLAEVLKAAVSDASETIRAMNQGGSHEPN